MAYRVIVAAVAALVGASAPARCDAAIVYGSSGFSFNLIPFGDDGTKGRPVPGDHIGNQVTLAPGTPRLLSAAHVLFGFATSRSEPYNITKDSYDLSIYANDGVQGQPGTLIASADTSAVDLPPTFGVDFSFPAVPVPDTFTAVVSSSHPTDTYNSPTGVVGAVNGTRVPDVGHAVNTVWYNSNSELTSWVADPNWAIADGATTNYFALTLEAVPAPEPSCVLLAPFLVLLCRRPRAS